MERSEAGGVALGRPKKEEVEGKNIKLLDRGRCIYLLWGWQERKWMNEVYSTVLLETGSAFCSSTDKLWRKKLDLLLYWPSPTRLYDNLKLKVALASWLNMPPNLLNLFDLCLVTHLGSWLWDHMGFQLKAFKETWHQMPLVCLAPISCPSSRFFSLLLRPNVHFASKIE